MSVTRSFRVPKEQHAQSASQRAEVKAAILAKYGVTFTPKDVSETEVEVTAEGPSDEVLDSVFAELKSTFAPQ